jgi:hypothetical protein
MSTEHRDYQEQDSRSLQFQNAVTGFESTVQQNDRNRSNILHEHLRLLMEGWQWLEHEGLIAVDPVRSNPVFKIITRRGLALSTEEELIDFAAAL